MTAKDKNKTKAGKINAFIYGRSTIPLIISMKPRIAKKAIEILGLFLNPNEVTNQLYLPLLKITCKAQTILKQPKKVKLTFSTT